ncbi:MAG TPA: hypothetical protein VJO53_10780 [Candidatus Acidoferrales bacterium]|nr:hypothetical protein [Candidatus Acidoferrales bacterium]
MSIAKWGLVILLLSPLGNVPAQAQQSTSSSDQRKDNSLGAAARRSQEQKKKDQPKSTKVWDNDNIPTTTGNINVVGQASAPANAPANSPAAGQDASSTMTPDEKAAAEADLSSAKAQLDSLKTDLDLLQRKNALDRRAYYGKPDYASDKAGAAALKDEQDQIDAKQQDLAAAQKRVDEAQAKLGPAGGDSSTPKK